MNFLYILVLISAAVLAVSAKPELCKLPLKAGNPETKCDLNVPRWYYNDKLNKCFMFFYSGCHGNENNFKNEAKCFKVCGDDRRPEDIEDVVISIADEVEAKPKVDL